MDRGWSEISQSELSGEERADRLASIRPVGITISGPFDSGAERHTAPRLKIPAFSSAISPIVSPSRSMWSMPSAVTTQHRGDGSAAVGSRRPPMPTSTTAALTRKRSIKNTEKTKNARKKLNRS